MADKICENEFIRQGILFGNEFGLPLGCVPTGNHLMAIDYPGLLTKIKDETGWKQSEIAKALTRILGESVSQTTISNWLNRKQSPNSKYTAAIDTLIEEHPRLEQLRKEIGSSTEVPVMGRIGAGASIEPDLEQIPPEGLYTVSVPFRLAGHLIAFVVEGLSMWPKYEEGDYVIVYADQTQSTEQYLGKYAAVETEDGRRYFKQIKTGSRPGLYRLESTNAPPIHDVSIRWVGELCLPIQKHQASMAEPNIRTRKGARSGARR